MTVSNVNISSATINNYVYIAVGGETSKSGADSNGLVLSYVPGKEQVFLNGALLVRNIDYTASDGSSITGLTALLASDVLEIIAFSQFNVSNTVPLSTVTTKGDLIAATSSGAVTRLGAGANSTILTADSTQTAGVKWSSSIVGAELVAPRELTTVSATAATGTVNFDLSTQGVLYFTSNASGNFNLNFRGNSGTTLNSMMAVGDAISAVFLNTNGSTAYYMNANPTVDTSATVTAVWSGGVAAASGNVSALDAYSFTIIKTASSTFTVLIGGPVKFA